MNGGTRAERIRALLQTRPGLDDDEIAAQLRIEPRQTVNQICRRLAEKGVLIRERGPGGKIVNTLTSGPLPAAPAYRTPLKAASIDTPGRSLVPDDFSCMLVIIPCSGTKRTGGSAGPAGEALTDHLPAEMPAELQRARAVVRTKVAFDETARLPAWQRYDGALYNAAGEAIPALIEAGAHVLILSGGYGVILAAELIGSYDTPLVPGWWPNRILERTLIAYAKRHDLASVRAFASETSPYRKVLQRIAWSAEGIADALLLSPEPQPGGMRKSPVSLGEALAALADRHLSSAWQSSYGLRLGVQRL